MDSLKTYLGYSVYATLFQDGVILLTTENSPPPDPSNSIFLYPEVLAKLMNLIRLLNTATGQPHNSFFMARDRVHTNLTDYSDDRPVFYDEDNPLEAENLEKRLSRTP